MGARVSLLARPTLSPGAETHPLIQGQGPTLPRARGVPCRGVGHHQDHCSSGHSASGLHSTFERGNGPDP